MSDAARSSATDYSDVDALVATLADAHRELERARGRVDAVGEDTLRDLQERYDELTALFDRYEERVTGDGDFQTFIEFQGKVAEFTEELPDDARHRDVFEDVDDLLQQRRLTESDWERVRERLGPVRRDVERLTERAEAREDYSDARYAVRSRRDDLAERIADLERLQRLGDADLDAPTERLRDPIDAYNQRVETVFETVVREAGARAVLELLAKTDAYPLVEFRTPPAALRAYVRDAEPGTEPVSQLLEYADYSRSKLDHYVDDPAALKQHVSAHRTYLRRLNAEPLRVAWPPPEAGILRYRCRELTSVVGRLVDADPVPESEGTAAMLALRAVRDLPRATDYERLRTSARARDRLSDEERDRLASGAVGEELAAVRDAKARLDDALDEYLRASALEE
jgi:hypothetical protein